MADEDPKPDERPRPQYGELAPPGWVWTPPEDVDRLDTARPNPTVDDEATQPSAPESARAPYRQAPPTTSPYPGAAPGAAPGRAPAPRWNLTLTILLIAFGFFGMSYSVAILQAFPTSMQLLHSSQGLGDFTPAAAVGTLIMVGTVTMTGLWALSTGLAVWQLVRRRMAFWIPLTAGVVALVVLFVFLAIILSTDPTLIDFYSGVMPASPAPTAPATP
ncbi:DUF6264 family protein [Leifsonia aquatica]|uniref:DUF6264 family protein n=1 Tax=Leifsonia aquatica TaxID=144185 RepID=UPI0038024F26